MMAFLSGILILFLVLAVGVGIWWLCMLPVAAFTKHCENDWERREKEAEAAWEKLMNPTLTLSESEEEELLRKASFC